MSNRIANSIFAGKILTFSMLLLCLVLPGINSVNAQEAQETQTDQQGETVPPVVVEQAPPPPPPATPTPPPAPPVVTAPAPAPVDEVVESPELPVEANSPFGARLSTGALKRAQQAAQPPINPRSITPADLEGFAASATNVTPEDLEEQQNRTTNEIFRHVPGFIVTNDDGAARHGGLAVRGSPPRRSRKLLVMEDGHAANLALWLDPSVHYVIPEDRIEAIEVIRGGVVSHGPNNNFGVVNFRMLSPFGPTETVISGALGWTEGSNVHRDVSNKRHIHTRRSGDRFGLVLSYSGADIEGAWNTEELTYDDFYAALGWKGNKQDLTVSFTYARQRDHYDESNLEGEEDEGELGEVEADFFELGHCKTCFAPGAIFNNYNGDIYRAQILHNLFLNQDTTITSRLYAQHHRRDRYQIVTLEDDPSDVEDDESGLAAVFGDEEDGLFEVLIPEDSMFGRLRTFRHIGGEIRAEFANRPFFGGMKQDIQAGVRYEYQDMTNRNFIGLSGQILEDGDKTGLTIFERNLESDAFSAFAQTAVHVNKNFTVVPGVRFEWYRVDRESLVTAEEEGEAEEIESDDCEEIAEGLDECLEIEGINRTPFNESFDTANVLPAISFAYTGLRKSTVYGGYHRGLSTAILRNENFPPPDEIGDNFEIGIRSNAIRGVTFDVAAFYKNIEDFQVGQAFSTAGDRGFGRLDEVEIYGVELYGRINSDAFTGGPWNLFAQGNYTYSHSEIVKGTAERCIEDCDDEDDAVFGVVSVAGNDLPEVPFQVAALTAGIQYKRHSGFQWDASVTATYRGSFFTDELNTPFGGNVEGEVGEVPDVWLWSARTNLKVHDKLSFFIAGTNLTDELYITDREDGLKPGQGRTIWTGFKLKLE